MFVTHHAHTRGTPYEVSSCRAGQITGSWLLIALFSPDPRTRSTSARKAGEVPGYLYTGSCTHNVKGPLKLRPHLISREAAMRVSADKCSCWSLALCWRCGCGAMPL